MYYSICTPPVIYIPEPCPDNCTNHGNCVNSTDATQNVTTYCQCNGGFTGINCGQYPVSSDITAIVAGTTAGVLAGIIVGVVCAAACFGGSGAFAYAQLNNPDGESNVSNNPTYKGKNNDGENPLHCNN
jgi:hypothetical protein